MQELELQQNLDIQAAATELTAVITSEDAGLDKFSVKLPIFDGHFEMLLDMIEKQSVDICDVSLSDVTGQYLEYLSISRSLNLSYSSEFLAIAAYLLELKSKRILPEDKEEEEIEEIKSSLVDHVEQYRIFKKISLFLKERKDDFSKIFHRFKIETADNSAKKYFLKDVSVSDLVDAFRKVWLEVKDRTDGMEIVDEVVTVEEKMLEIRTMLTASSEGIEFESIFRTKTRLEVIVTFLAVLELVRMRELAAKQDGIFGQIKLFSSQGSAQ